MKYLAVTLLVAALAAPALPAAAASVATDPQKTVGPEACKQCHDREYEVWRQTKHAALYASEQALSRRPRAQEIARKLGVALIQHDSLCLNCHFTPRLLSGKVTARAGVSCESCHGAARDWITVHNTFRGRQVHRASESAEERRQRQERNAEAGMRAGGRIYDLAARCFQCHKVPEERLVDTGGHSAGGDFDLVERFDAIRHDFVAGGRAANAPLTPERRRQFYVLGLALDLEYGLRGIAAAREGGVYVESLARGVEKTRKRLRKALSLAPRPQLAAALAAADGLRLEANNAAEVGYAVERVAAAARGFAEQEDGSRLASLDPLLAPQEEAAAEPAPELETPAGAATATTAPGGGGAPGQRGASPAAAKDRGAGPVGQVSAHLRPPLSKARVLGPDGCSAACHKMAVSWWVKDRHQRAAEPFLNRARRNVQIATLYYGRPAGDAIATGRLVCMDCHGTVLTGKAAAEVENGVGCESCHGPAGSFRDLHKDKKSHGERLALGIVDLQNLDRRAAVCAGCHYVTDPRLLASGHTSGQDFDPVAGSRKIEHWTGGQPAAAALLAAYRKVLAARGAVPQVQVARLEGAADAGAAGSAAAGPGRAAGAPAAGGGGASGRRAAGGRPLAPPPFAPGGAAPARAAGRPLALPPLPAGSENLPTAEILRLVQQRLATLYAATGQ
jgi:cytochrome c554/c'-like protein